MRTGLDVGAASRVVRVAGTRCQGCLSLRGPVWWLFPTGDLLPPTAVSTALLAESSLCCLLSKPRTRKASLYKVSKPRSPYKLSCTKNRSISSHRQHTANTAQFLRVSGLVVDCCRPSHSTAAQSNRPRLLLSSSLIDSSAIHRLTTALIVTHPRLSHSAHSTSPLNSKFARPPSLVLWRVTRNLRVAAARATRKQPAHQQPAA